MFLREFILGFLFIALAFSQTEKADEGNEGKVEEGESEKKGSGERCKSQTTDQVLYWPGVTNRLMFWFSLQCFSSVGKHIFRQTFQQGAALQGLGCCQRSGTAA